MGLLRWRKCTGWGRIFTYYYYIMNTTSFNRSKTTVHIPRRWLEVTSNNILEAFTMSKIPQKKIKKIKKTRGELLQYIENL